MPIAWRSVPRKPSWQQHQRNQQEDQHNLTEALDSHKLQVPGQSCNWQGFQAWDTFQDTTDNGNIDTVETSLEQQEHFSLFQDAADALPYHTSIFLYACESWTLTAELQRRIQAREMRCYCRLLMSTMHLIQRNITNNEVCAKIQQAIRPHEDLLTIVKRCKLKWYRHVSHSSGLAKTILQGLHWDMFNQPWAIFEAFCLSMANAPRWLFLKDFRWW